jgi:hypothetical protein
MVACMDEWMHACLRGRMDANMVGKSWPAVGRPGLLLQTHKFFSDMFKILAGRRPARFININLISSY